MKISQGTVLLLLAVVGSLAGLLSSFAVTPRYVSSATLSFADSGIEGTAPEVHRHLVDFFVQCQADVLSRTSLSTVINSPPLSLYPDERSQLPLEDVIEAMRKQLKVEIVDRPGYPRERFTVFKISFPYRNPFKAQLTVQLLITRFIDTAQTRSGKEVAGSGGPPPLRERLAQLEARVAALEGHRPAQPGRSAQVTVQVPPSGITFAGPLPVGPVYANPEFLAAGKSGMGAEGRVPPPVNTEAPRVNVSVIEPPTLPDSPVYPNRWLFTAAGLAIGLLGTGIGLFFQKRLKLQS